jgi:hypothetical protein
MWPSKWSIAHYMVRALRSVPNNQSEIPTIFFSTLYRDFEWNLARNVTPASTVGVFFAPNFVQNLYTVLKKRLCESRSTPTLVLTSIITKLQTFHHGKGSAHFCSSAVRKFPSSGEKNTAILRWLHPGCQCVCATWS